MPPLPAPLAAIAGLNSRPLFRSQSTFSFAHIRYHLKDAMDAIWVAVTTPLVTFFLSIIGLAGFTVYAVFRLNSPQIIREKIWNAFVGDKDFNDEKPKSFSHSQLDLARFRVVYGVPTAFTKDRKRLLKHDTAIKFFNEVLAIAQQKASPASVQLPVYPLARQGSYRSTDGTRG
jgi:Family of unknown function (DUF6216)